MVVVDEEEAEVASSTWGSHNCAIFDVSLTAAAAAAVSLDTAAVATVHVRSRARLHVRLSWLSASPSEHSGSLGPCSCFRCFSSAAPAPLQPLLICVTMGKEEGVG